MKLSPKVFTNPSKVVKIARWATAEFIHTMPDVILNPINIYQLTNIEYNDLTAVFSEYRIDAVKIRYQLISNPDAANATLSPTLGNATNWYPRVWYALSHTDQQVANLTQMKNYSGAKCRVLEPNKFVDVMVRFPRIKSVVQLEGPATTVAGAVAKPQFLACVHNHIDHFGLLTCFESNLNAVNDQPFLIKEERQYFVSFKRIS